MALFKKLTKKLTGSVFSPAGLLFGPTGVGLNLLGDAKKSFGNIGSLLKSMSNAQFEMNRKNTLNLVRGKTGEDFDRQTRTELYNLLQPGNDRKDIVEGLTLFRDAKEGTDKKFISRKATDELHDFLVDQPGKNQTRINNFTNAATQLFRGRG